MQLWAIDIFTDTDTSIDTDIDTKMHVDLSVSINRDTGQTLEHSMLVSTGAFWRFSSEGRLPRHPRRRRGEPRDLPQLLAACNRDFPGFTCKYRSAYGVFLYLSLSVLYLRMFIILVHPCVPRSAVAFVSYSYRPKCLPNIIVGHVRGI